MFVCSFQGTCLTDVISHSDTKSCFVLGSLIKPYSDFIFLIRQPPALPCRLQHSTIGLLGLNHRVRDGYGCFPQAHRHRNLLLSAFRLLITKQYNQSLLLLFLRKEVIQPHLPIRLPCYDFTPIIRPTFGRALLAVRLRTSGVPDSHGVTGGVYKARERIHRGMLIRDY